MILSEFPQHRGWEFIFRGEVDMEIVNSVCFYCLRCFMLSPIPRCPIAVLLAAVFGKL